MRVAVLGKGGSGKTTVAALLSIAALARGFKVIAIDADINQHLGSALGIEKDQLQEHASLTDKLKELKELVRGTNQRISLDSFVKTTPPGRGSFFISSDDTEVLSQFALIHQGVVFLRAGDLDSSEIGTHCYHSKVGSVEIFLNHFIDKRDCLVVVDMTAGADCFASEIFSQFDLLVVVVEPTVRSLEVYNQIKKYGGEYLPPLVICANKVQSKEDRDFLISQTQEAPLAEMPYDKKLQYSVSVEGCMDSQYLAHLLEPLFTKLGSLQNDNNQRYQALVHFHKKNALEWANALYGLKLEDQIDPNFNPQIN